MKFLNKSNSQNLISNDLKTIKIVSSAKILKIKKEHICLDGGKLPGDNNDQTNFKSRNSSQCIENVCAEVNMQDIKSVSNNSEVKSDISSCGNSSDKNENYSIFNINRISHENEIGNDRPFYFGVRSYLHNFYDPPDKDVMKSGEFMQEDFLIERTNKKRGCCLQSLLWMGINLSIIGVIILLIGFLVPLRNTIVGSHDNLQIFDRYAIAFNHHLQLCRFIGFIITSIGVVVTVIVHYISKKYSKKEPTNYYVLGATILPEMFIGNPIVGSHKHTTNVTAESSRHLSKAK